MPDPTSPQPSRPHKDIAPKPLWRRIFAAQESGLVVVIALMMAALTIFGGTKSVVVKVDIPRDEHAVVESLHHFELIIPGTLTNSVHASQTPWEYTPNSDGTITAIGTRPQLPGARIQVTIPVRGNGPDTRVEYAERDLNTLSLGVSSVRSFISESQWRIKAVEDGNGAPRIAYGTRSVNKFLDVENLLNVLTTASYYAIMAVGMTAIIILAGIDLSIGSIYAIAAILGASALSIIESKSGGGGGGGTSALIAVPLLLLICCSVGALGGFINGFSSVALRVHPFIITLGTMAIYRGAVFVFTQGQTVSGLPDSIQRGFFKWEIHVGSGGGGGVFPVPTLITAIVGLAGAVVLSRTVFGRRIYAIGGNEVAAKYAGIPVGRVKTMVYTISGALAGLAAAIYVGYFGAAENGAGQGYELNVIAAAVIGGASLSGGRGSALGAVLGAILVQLINNGMLILDINQSYNQIVMGLAIIIAVVVDQTKTRLTK